MNFLTQVKNFLTLGEEVGKRKERIYGTVQLLHRTEAALMVKLQRNKFQKKQTNPKKQNPCLTIRIVPIMK